MKERIWKNKRQERWNMYFWKFILKCLLWGLSRWKLKTIKRRYWMFDPSWMFEYTSRSGIYLFKVNSRKNRTTCQICSKFHTFFCCFYCWLWASKFISGRHWYCLHMCINAFCIAVLVNHWYLPQDTYTQDTYTNLVKLRCSKGNLSGSV